MMTAEPPVVSSGLDYAMLEPVVGRLASAGLTLTLNAEGGLHVAPKARINDSLLALIKRHREDLITLVRERDAARERHFARLAEKSAPDSPVTLPDGPVSTQSAVLGEKVIIVPDWYPCGVIWNGSVVYRHCEMVILKKTNHHSLREYHRWKRQLLPVWEQMAGSGWVSLWDEDTPLRTIVIGAGIPWHVVQDAITMFTRTGILAQWNPMIDWIPRWRLLRPDADFETESERGEERTELRARAAEQQAAAIISGEISEGFEDFGDEEDVA